MNSKKTLNLFVIKFLIKMKNLFITTLFFLALSINAQDYYELEGVKIPRSIQFESQKLQLNGFGARSKMLMDVYIQALYLSRFFPNALDIIDSDATMAIRIQVISSLVTSKKLTKAFNKGLEKSIGEEGMKKIETQAKMLEELLAKEDTKNGDFFNLIYYNKDQSTWVYKNDRLEGKIPGLEFKKAFFGIWLSNDPVDATLKQQLLGN